MTVAVLLVGTGVVYAFDASRENRIADGMRIGGVDVGGLSADDARTRSSSSELVAPLEQHGGRACGRRALPPDGARGEGDGELG